MFSSKGLYRSGSLRDAGSSIGGGGGGGLGSRTSDCLVSSGGEGGGRGLGSKTSDCRGGAGVQPVPVDVNRWRQSDNVESFPPPATQPTVVYLI